MVLKRTRAPISANGSLEEDEITWYSNVIACKPLEGLGLEENEITWYSNSF